jgi:hypothetical protein
VEGFGFQFLCCVCLQARGALDTPELPVRCPCCGTPDPWIGPVPRERIISRYSDAIVESPFYLAADSARPG